MKLFLCKLNIGDWDFDRLRCRLQRYRFTRRRHIMVKWFVFYRWYSRYVELFPRLLSFLLPRAPGIKVFGHFGNHKILNSHSPRPRDVTFAIGHFLPLCHFHLWKTLNRERGNWPSFGSPETLSGNNKIQFVELHWLCSCKRLLIKLSTQISANQIND